MSTESSLESRLPIETQSVALGAGRIGLVVVDAGVGFTREGNLADPERIENFLSGLDRGGHLPGVCRSPDPDYEAP